MPPKATKAQKLSADTTTVVPASSSSTAAEADAVIAAAATAGADADANATAGAAEGPDAAAAVKEHPTMTLWKALKYVLLLIRCQSIHDNSSALELNALAHPTTHVSGRVSRYSSFAMKNHYAMLSR